MDNFGVCRDYPTLLKVDPTLPKVDPYSTKSRNKTRTSPGPAELFPYKTPMVSLRCPYRTTLSHPHDIIDPMKVRVYYNLHKHCLSVQHLIDGRWRVCSYTNEIHLRDVTFTVSQKSRQRVIKEKRKNVHAFIIGTVVDNSDDTPIRVTYNPYLYDSFVECGSNTPIHYADRAHIVGRAIRVAR